MMASPSDTFCHKMIRGERLQLTSNCSWCLNAGMFIFQETIWSVQPNKGLSCEYDIQYYAISNM